MENFQAIGCTNGARGIQCREFVDIMCQKYVQIGGLQKIYLMQWMPMVVDLVDIKELARRGL